ncbi:unnamed protein product [Lupinus luteus]|uniref:Uncharacterized protein n=1 Tax=Lupinus luteus TaxID=3873 RepID=A0AAV1Y3R8_LUPLU
MAAAREENSYENGGGEAGFGKFRRRPLRRTQTTPYDRPATALRNPNRINGLLSKIVNPAQRFIAYSAHKLFSSVFRKRLPPPPTTPSSGIAYSTLVFISLFVKGSARGGRGGKGLVIRKFLSGVL